MQLFELHEILEKGENGTIEFKRKFSSPEKIAKEMIAFANTKGGYVIFGIDDDRSVVGVESEKGEIELIEMAAKFFCEPEIEYKTDIIPIYRKDVVIVEIPESRFKPHKLVVDGKDDPYRVYIRVKDKSVLASKETVRILRKSHPDSPPLILNLTEKEKVLLDYLGIHEKITMKEFKEMLNISNRRASRILVNLVRAELIRQHNTDKEDFYTLS